MTFTIEQLEALKEGTTPGPWGVDNSDPDWPILTGPLVLEGNLISQEILADLGGELSDPNFHMILATPAVIDQLIAAETKLQQLKEQIEGLADWHDTKAMKARDFPWPGGQHAARFRGKAEAHETARNKLTQILEGHND